MSSDEVRAFLQFNNLPADRLVTPVTVRWSCPLIIGHLLSSTMSFELFWAHPSMCGTWTESRLFPHHLCNELMTFVNLFLVYHLSTPCISLICMYTPLCRSVYSHHTISYSISWLWFVPMTNGLKYIGKCIPSNL